MVSLVNVKNIFITFNHRCILSNVSLNLISNKIVTLIGPNGAGKSTLVKVILGLLTPDSGHIIRKININIGYVPQKLHLDTLLPITVNRFMKLSYKVKQTSIKKMLQRMKIWDIKNVQLHQLSGGEMQRMLLARALLNKPDLLILDEFTQGIDIQGQVELYSLINQIHCEFKCAILMVSHDLNLVMSYTDEVYCLNTYICCSGTPEIVCRNKEFIAMFGLTGIKNFAVYYHQHKKTS
ncbi:zinc ABC transporter ATP-binding protein ZnuC [Buchnera aphidicola (Formosaphis micheliae)]|uniref:zinc ABC transporter ATP-binding protein ZnuC n=1 Tax=Buchnera aphidicola TaxID=9 RepID=UPI0031B8898C